MLRSLIRSLKNAPEKTTGATAQQVIAKDLKSNKAERDTLVGSFGICGLLETRDHPGHFEHFVPANERDLPSHHFIDMAYPACWWRGSDGLAEDAVEFYFGQFL